MQHGGHDISEKRTGERPDMAILSGKMNRTFSVSHLRHLLTIETDSWARLSVRVNNDSIKRLSEHLS